MELELIHQKFLKCTDTTFDSREVKEDTFFIALKGETTDGNKYIEQALNNGASFCLISDITENAKYKDNDRCIIVQDTLKAFQELAGFHRRTFSIPVIAIGGSNGKTTTKELTACVLSKKYKTISTYGSFNNHTGVPLTLLSIKPEDEIAVIEIGANHKHEHEELINIIFPTHIFVTNNGKDHLEGFGSAEGAREANNELYNYAKENNTKVFVNIKHEDQVSDCKNIEIEETNLIYFGDDYALEHDSNNELSNVSLKYSNGDIFKTNLVGEYNSENIATSICIGKYFGIDINKISEALKEYIPKSLRSTLINEDHFACVIDCYNANPSSMRLSLNSFFKNTVDKDRIIVLAEMRELGTHSKTEHQEIVNLIEENCNKNSNDIVILIGDDFVNTQGLENAKRFKTNIEAMIFFKDLVKENHSEDTTKKYFFFKGSRGPDPKCPILLPLVEELIGRKIY